MKTTFVRNARTASQIICLAICLLLGVMFNSAAGSDSALTMPSDSLETTEMEETELAFDDEESGELEMEEDDSINGGPSDGPSLLSQILKPARFTIRYELSYKTESPAGMINNRSSFRLEYSTFFLDQFYIQFDAKLNAFWEDDHRAEAEEKDVLLETSSREAFVQASFAETSIRVGTQVMIWGESDGGAITDVISPRNYSELFFISLEESRIGQPMVALDQFSSIGQWSVFYVPDPEFNTYPEEGTAYAVDPFEGMAEYRDEEGDESLDEFGVRWKKTFGKSDVSIMAASLMDNDYAYRMDGFTGSGQYVISKTRQRYSMLGTAFNYVTGSFLLKGEIARKSPRVFNDASYQLIERDVLDVALGLEYSQGGTYSLGLELVNNHVDDWSDDLLGVPEDARSLVLVWNQTFLNEDLSLNWMTQATVPYAAYIHSLTSSYKWNDGVTIYLEGYCPDIRDEESALWVYRDQKQLVLKAQYQF